MALENFTTQPLGLETNELRGGQNPYIPKRKKKKKKSHSDDPLDVVKSLDNNTLSMFRDSSFFQQNQYDY